MICKNFKQKESLASGVVLLLADRSCCNCSKFVSVECLEYLEKVKRDKRDRLVKVLGWMQ